MQKHIVSNKEKRSVQERHLYNVEQNQKGNPLLKGSLDIDVPMSAQDKKNLEFLDSFGNPIKGYKWSKVDNQPVVVPENYIETVQEKVEEDHTIHRFKTKGLMLDPNNPTVKRMIRKGTLVKAKNK
jgi:hypothetical protein